MKKEIKKERITLEAKIPMEEAFALARKMATKDEVLVVRVDKKRKNELKKSAKKAGISLSSYLLMAESSYRQIMGQITIKSTKRSNKKAGSHA